MQDAAAPNIKDESELERLKSFLDEYKRKQTNDAVLDLNTLVTMAQPQFLITILVHEYAILKLSAHPPTGREIPNPGPISPTEKRRMYRAFYRFELFRHLFPPVSYIDDDLPPGSMDDCEISDIFLSLFPC